MWSVVVGALAARRGHAVTVALVGLLACAATGAAPWFALAAVRAVPAAAAAGAPDHLRLIAVSGTAGRPGSGSGQGSGEELEPGVEPPRRPAVESGSGPPSAPGPGPGLGPPGPLAGLADRFAGFGFTGVAGGQVTGDLYGTGGPHPGELPGRPVRLAYRQDVCAHLEVTGTCPASAGEVLAPGSAGLTAGERFELVTYPGGRDRVRVVGLYRVVEAADPYWGGGGPAGVPDSGEHTGAQPEPATLFTVAGGVWGDPPREVLLTLDLVAPPEAFGTADLAGLEAAVRRTVRELGRDGYAVVTGVPDLVGRIAADRRDAVAGVGVGVVHLLLLSWFALVVVVRSGTVALRGDLAWWRLRGAVAGRGALATWGQAAVPVLAGAGPGAGLGAGLGALATGGGAADATGWLAAAGLVGLTVAGALVAVVGAQLGSLRRPARELLRSVPARAGRWRRSLVDLVLVGLALAAVGQALLAGGGTRRAPGGGVAGAGGGGEPGPAAGVGGGLGLLAPGLAAFAAVLVAGWMLPRLLERLLPRMLKAGRQAAVLVVAPVSRRGATGRLFALVGVAVALVTVAWSGVDADARTRLGRAELETGAARVLTVAAPDGARLLAAVRAADPTGEEAMAVVRTPARGSSPGMLAVDSPRLAVVAGWREEYGASPARVAAALRQPAPDPVLVTARHLDLVAAGTDPAGRPVHLRALLRRLDTGELVEAVSGPVASGSGRYRLPVPGCAAGCRLVGFEILGPARLPPAGGYAAAAAGTRVHLHRLEAGPVVLSADRFADPARWRPGLGAGELGPVLGGGGDGMRLTVPGPGPGRSVGGTVLLGRTDQVFTVDAPAPVPVLVTGWTPPPGWGAQPRLPLLGGSTVPVRPVGSPALVPALGPAGAVVDLEYATRLAPLAGGPVTAQVWLSEDASVATVDRLWEAGLVPVREESVAGSTGALANRGAATGLRFQLWVALVVLCLAAGAVLVSSGQGLPRQAADLAALRVQGLGSRVTRMVGYAVPAALVVAGCAAGLVAGVLGAALARTLDAGFVDGWAWLPPAGLHPLPVAAAALAGVALVVPAVLVPAVATARRDRRPGRSLSAGANQE